MPNIFLIQYFHASRFYLRLICPYQSGRCPIPSYSIFFQPLYDCNLKFLTSIFSIGLQNRRQNSRFFNRYNAFILYPKLQSQQFPSYIRATIFDFLFESTRFQFSRFQIDDASILIQRNFLTKYKSNAEHFTEHSCRFVLGKI